MDDPALDRSRHFSALSGLARLNGLSRSAEILWTPIARLARELNVDRLRILDVATGAGDIPWRLWRKGKRAGFQLEIHGLDISPQALEFARREVERQHASIEFQCLNVLQEEWPRDFDVVVSSLFVHHLADRDIVSLLRRMQDSARHLVLINDLRRGVSGWLLAAAAARVFTRSDVVHFDAPASAKAALRIDEMKTLATEAGLNDAVVQRRWPCRFLLTWRRSGEAGLPLAHEP